MCAEHGLPGAVWEAENSGHRLVWPRDAGEAQGDGTALRHEDPQQAEGQCGSEVTAGHFVLLCFCFVFLSPVWLTPALWPVCLLKSWEPHVESVAACLTSLAGSEVQTWTLWSLRSQVQNLMHRFCQVPIQSKFSRANITRPIGCLLDLCFFKPWNVMDHRLVQSHYFKGERPFLPDWHANMTFEIANQGQTAKIENIRD